MPGLLAQLHEPPGFARLDVGLAIADLQRGAFIVQVEVEVELDLLFQHALQVEIVHHLATAAQVVLDERQVVAVLLTEGRRFDQCRGQVDGNLLELQKVGVDVVEQRLALVVKLLQVLFAVVQCLGQRRRCLVRAVLALQRAEGIAGEEVGQCLFPGPPVPLPGPAGRRPRPRGRNCGAWSTRW
ncbi:hypothetical protein NWF32_29530 [Pseudomonas qingdaonensis]|nr:hypothetical protein [Pseudomonas qingdaonensis]